MFFLLSIKNIQITTQNKVLVTPLIQSLQVWILDQQDHCITMKNERFLKNFFNIDDKFVFSSKINYVCIYYYHSLQF